MVEERLTYLQASETYAHLKECSRTIIYTFYRFEKGTILIIQNVSLVIHTASNETHWFNQSTNQSRQPWQTGIIFTLTLFIFNKTIHLGEVIQNGSMVGFKRSWRKEQHDEVLTLIWLFHRKRSSLQAHALSFLALSFHHRLLMHTTYQFLDNRWPSTQVTHWWDTPYPYFSQNKHNRLPAD